VSETVPPHGVPAPLHCHHSGTLLNSKGNLQEYEQEIETNKKMWIKRGIYFNLETLKNLVYRNLFKKVLYLYQ
jgi:hypothetical protein